MGSRLAASSSLLRYALLASLGLLGAACGGSWTGDDGDDGDDGPRDLSECSSPRVDPKTKLTVCAEGYSHRPTAERCQPPSGDADAPGGAAPPETALCGAEDCSTLRNGYCSYGSAAPQCKSGCVEDADCDSGFVCSCAPSNSPTGGECVPSDCTTDADCGGTLCASARQVCGEPRFACLSEADECVKDADCPNGGICEKGSTGGRACFGGACGRPFLVLSQPRLPPVTERGDWLLFAAPRVEHLNLRQRAAEAAHWMKLGQMEHASIAAFARFSLQLLSLGAPPELVEQCTRALGDETAHTKLCFGIASAYAGHAIGPGPLDVTNSLEVTSLVDIVDLVIAEGCIGETSAALEALEAAQDANDPVIRAAYTQIARDEQRHAELAFHFVRWALQRGGSDVRERIAAALESDFAANDSARSVVEPCLAALLTLSRAA